MPKPPKAERLWPTGWGTAMTALVEVAAPLLHVLANHGLHLLELVAAEDVPKLHLVVVVDLPHLPVQTHDLLTKRPGLVPVEVVMGIDLVVQLPGEAAIAVAEL